MWNPKNIFIHPDYHLHIFSQQLVCLGHGKIRIWTRTRDRMCLIGMETTRKVYYCCKENKLSVYIKLLFLKRTRRTWRRICQETIKSEIIPLFHTLYTSLATCVKCIKYQHIPSFYHHSLLIITAYSPRVSKTWIWLDQNGIILNINVLSYCVCFFSLLHSLTRIAGSKQNDSINDIVHKHQFVELIEIGFEHSIYLQPFQ